jgi:hypothetical protein
VSARSTSYLERARTQEALAVVRGVLARLGPVTLKDVATRLEPLPVELRQDGVALVLASLVRQGGAKVADRKRAGSIIADWLSQWLVSSCPSRPLGAGGAGDVGGASLAAAFTRLESADEAQWGAATEEAIAFAACLKVFAKAMTEAP